MEGTNSPKTGTWLPDAEMPGDILTTTIPSEPAIARPNERMPSCKEVKIRFRLRDLAEVDAAAGTVKCLIALHLYWQDKTLINRSYDDIDWEKIWQPDVLVLNALETSSDKNVWELLDPSSGHVKLKMMMTCIVSNWMDLADFPFDQDTITISVRPKIHTEDVMYFKVDDKMSEVESVGGETSIGLLGVPEVKVESQYKASTNKYCPCVNMLVPIKRLYGYYLARVFLVLYFLIIMSWSTFSMGPDEFGDRMSINLTLFLSAVAFVFTVNEGLPKVPYLTYLDRFLTSCFVHLFFAVVENYIVYLLAKNSNYTDAANIIDYTSHAVFPTSFFVTNLALWIHMRRRRTKEFRYLDQALIFQGRLPPKSIDIKTKYE